MDLQALKTNDENYTHMSNTERKTIPRTSHSDC